MTEAKPLLTYQTIDGIVVGTVVGTTMLDGLSVTDFGNQVVAYVSDKPGINLLLDFKNVTYMTSQGLTELLRISETLQKHAGSIRLCNVTPDIHRVFKITNLEKMFSINEQEDTASAVRRFVRAAAVAAQEKAWAGPNSSR